ncbi:MAG TPA: TonB-dependent receptor [Thermoanaerobaculia bacterium]|jgi:outer membrane cobalamin receptor
MTTLRWLLVALLASSVLADEPPVVKQEIVVTAARDEEPRDRASAAVTVLTREDIERLPATSLAELLAFVPGVTMMFDSGTNGVPMVTSRGFFGGGEVEYVKLLVDGVPVGDAESGNVDWRGFRAADIERLEVLHGPGSALYGDTALGGVVQLFTRQEPEGGSRGELQFRAGSFDAREADVRFATDLGKLRLSVRGSSGETGGFRDHAATHDRGLQLSLVHFDDASRWRVDVSGTRKHRREPGALTRSEIGDDRTQSSPLFRFDREETDRGRLSAAYESFGAIPWQATVYGTQRDGDTLRTLLLAPGFGTTALRALTTRAFGTTLEASRELAGGTVRAGADVERASLSGRYSAVDDGEPLGVTASQDGHRDRTGVFLTGGWNVCSRCRLTAGIRRDDIRDDFNTTRHHASAWSPRAGFNVHVGRATATPLSLFVQLSNAFKAPTLDQLFDPRPYPDGTGGTFTVSNPDLRPQRARNIEAGLARHAASNDWSLVAYRMNVRDEIDFDPQTFSYRNIGSSLHRGVEASLAVAKTSWLSPRVTYAWTRVADAEAPDRQLKNIPEHVAQLLLHARVRPSTNVDLLYRWTHGTTLDDAGAFSTPDVSRVDLRISHDLATLRLQLDVLNVLNAEYNEAGYVLLDFTGQPTALEFPAAGRIVRLGATWRF